MKKFLLTLFIISITTLSGHAIERISATALPAQSYLVLLETPATVVLPSNKSVIEAEILNTIFNQRTQILVKTLVEGVSRLYITSENEVSVIEFNVNANNEDVENTATTKTVKAVVKIDAVQNPKKNNEKKTQEPQAELEKLPVIKGE